MFSYLRISPPMALLVLAVSAAAEPAPRDRFGDPLPDGAIARLGNLRLRPDRPIVSGAFSPDGKLLATVDANGAIICWDPASGKEVRRLTVNLPRPLRELRFLDNGKSLILAGGSGAFRKGPAGMVNDSALRIVDAVTGMEQRKLDSPDHAAIHALDVTPDGKTAVALHSPGTVVVWDLAAGQPLHTFKELSNNRVWQTSPSQLAALTPDGKQLVLPHADGSLHLLDLATGKEVLAFEMPPPRDPNRPANQMPQKVAVSPDGRYLAYGGIMNAAALCDLKTGKRVHEFAPFRGSTVGLAFTPDSRFLAVCGLGNIRVYGVISGKELRHFAGSSDTRSTVAFTPDGRMLASFAGNTPISLWDVAVGRPVHPSAGHRSSVWALTFFPDGKRLASAGRSDGLIVWDIASGRDIAYRQAYFPFSNSFIEVEDGSMLRYLATDQAIHRWDPTSGDDERQQLPRMLTSSASAVSPDGRGMTGLSSAHPQRLSLFDLRETRPPRVLELPKNVRIIRTLFSPDGQRVAASASDGVLRVWDHDSGRLVDESKPEVRRRIPSLMAFAADGRSLAVFDGDLYVREIVGGGERFHLHAPLAVSALAFSPNGRFLSCGHPDGRITVHDIAAGKQWAQWQGRQGVVHALAFSRDTRLLASGGENGTIIVWKVFDKEALPAALKAEEAAAFWQALAAEDAARANRALAGLAAAPAQALPLIKERFRPKAMPPSPERLARLIAELDDDSFKVRQRASRELSEAGPDVADALREALANDPSVETRQRIEALLKRMPKGGDPERLRCLRALEVLERIGTPQARDVLRELAGKELDPTLHEEVRATLQRMGLRR